ncbi:MAG TPA: CRISPR-associated endonuclease Cas1 [Candidatus Atribacteria bacterium]|nr:CRISPR-associated endonuclease Cas1 [Candidatus Atribacteria bacterium]
MIEKRLRNVVISGYGYKIKCRKNLVLIKGENENIIISPREIEQLVITGAVSLTSDVVRVLMDNNVDIVFVGHRPKFFARIVRSDYNFITDLWRKQIMLPTERRLEIAKEIVDCLIYNKLRMLQHLEKNRDIDFSVEIDRLKYEREKSSTYEDIPSLMGVEGDATRIYFSAVRKIIPKEFGFKKRVKHPPLDPINSMLSYGYTILLSRVSYGLLLSGLNVYEGILHESYRNREALAYDLMEEFRQPIVDRVVITFIVRGMVKTDDFDIRKEMCYMKENFKRNYLDSLYSRFENMYRYLGKPMEFLDIIFEQAKKLSNAIKNDEKYVGFRYR